MNTTRFFILTITALAFTMFDAKANDEPKTSRIGIKGGINFASLYNSQNSSKTAMTTGFNLGLFAKLRATDKIALQPELYFTRKGAEVTYNNTFATGTARFNLNYIEIPLLLVINITPNINIHAGPYAAFLLNGKTINKSNVTLFDFEQSIKTSDYNRYDMGMALGFGLDLGSIGLGARWNYGFTSIGKSRTFLGYTYTYPDAKNNVINLYVSLALN